MKYTFLFCININYNTLPKKDKIMYFCIFKIQLKKCFAAYEMGTVYLVVFNPHYKVQLKLPLLAYSISCFLMLTANLNLF